MRDQSKKKEKKKAQYCDPRLIFWNMKSKIFAYCIYSCGNRSPQIKVESLGTSGTKIICFECLVVRWFITFHLQVLVAAMSFSTYCKRKENSKITSFKQSINSAYNLHHTVLSTFCMSNNRKPLKRRSFKMLKCSSQDYYNVRPRLQGATYVTQCGTWNFRLHF